MLQSTPVSTAAHMPAATMDALAPWVPVALAAVALLAIVVLVFALMRRRKGEADQLDDTLADAKQAVREDGKPRARHAK